MTIAPSHDPAPQAGHPGGSKQPPVRLGISQVNPWSVMKFTFVLLIVLGAISVALACLIWWLLQAAGIFDQLTNALGIGDTGFKVTDLVSVALVAQVTAAMAVMMVVVLTALATLVTSLLNLGCRLVGPLEVTMRATDGT